MYPSRFPFTEHLKDERCPTNERRILSIKAFGLQGNKSALVYILILLDRSIGKKGNLVVLISLLKLLLVLFLGLNELLTPLLE
jgi:hypothetical protein